MPIEVLFCESQIHHYMEQPGHYIHLEGLLNQQQLDEIERHLSIARFADGKQTASAKAKSVKNNLQVDLADQNTLGQLQQIIGNAMMMSPHFQAAVLPKFIYPPVFSKYESGMEYGWHTDSPIMGQQPPIRTDMGITIFLSDPASYEGGELEVQTSSGLSKYKLAKGDAICYPTTQLHRVAPIQSGIRLAAVSWVQCSIREPQKREILYGLSSVHGRMLAKDMDSQEAPVVLQTYSNLMRMWAEL